MAGDARALPFASGRFDVRRGFGAGAELRARPERALAEQTRVGTGTVAAYVWDYADGMAMMRLFWAAAREVDPAAPDEGRRFPLCRPEPLAELWQAAGLTGVAVTAIEVPTVFTDFDDYWRPFLGGQGAAPAYLATRPPAERDAIRELLRQRLPDHDIELTARVWAVRGSSR